MAELASLLPLIQGTTSLVGGASQYSASTAGGRYARRVGNINAELALQQAEEAEAVGVQEASRRLQQGSIDASSMRAKYAAQGIAVDSGSAAAVQQGIKGAAAQDAATIRRNAALQSWGYGVDAANSRTRGRMGYISGKYEGTQSLISGGMQFARYGIEAANEYDKASKTRKPEEDYFPNRPG